MDKRLLKYFNKDVVIHCPTEGEYLELLKYIDNIDKHWESYWNTYKDKTCVCIETYPHFGTICGVYKEWGYTILEFDDVFKRGIKFM